MTEENQQLLPLDIERVVAFRAGDKIYRHVFRRITAKDWDGFFAKIEAEIEQSDGKVTRTVCTESASLWLYSQCVVRAEGYRVSDGRKLEELPEWRERVPVKHRMKAAEVLVQVLVANGAEGVIEAEGEIVMLDAVWSAEGEGNSMTKYTDLVHRFATPSADQRRRFLRARSRTTVVGGSRSGRTLMPSTQTLLAKLYDELIVSVDGYAVNGRPLGSSREEIVHEIDAFHKVIAAREIFETRMPEEATEASGVSIAVERDSDGIRQAALELMEETLDRDEQTRVERIAMQAEDPAAVLAAAAPKRKFSPGYYLWVEYLLGLEAEMEAGVAIAAALAGADVAGILAVREARLEFERLHPRCGCGRLLKNAWDKQCPACQGAA